MQVTVNGWGRDSGPKMVMATELEEGYLPDRRRNFKSGKTYVGLRSAGVVIQKGPFEFTLGGKYLVTVTLTKEDLLRLCVEAFRKGLDYKTMGAMQDHAKNLGLVPTDEEDDESEN